jgi:hypothetical protein
VAPAQFDGFDVTQSALADTAKEDAMTSKIFGSIVALVLACSSATAADIRRVVTALDANDKAIALFDGRVTLEPGATPSAKLWVTEAAPAPRCSWSNFRRSIRPKRRKWTPTS